MARVDSFVDIPLAPGYPMPSVRLNASDYKLSARVSYDDSFTTDKLCFYFHGSGSTDFLEGPLLDALLADGFSVVCTMALGSGSSSPSPYRYGYGNVNAPHFLAHFIKDAWWVESVIAAYEPGFDASTGVILGHSRGAAAALAWAAGYSGRTSFPEGLKGVVASGATVAGLGDLSWNDVNRNINTLSGIVNRLRVKTIMAYGNLDTYGPPDYARRLQMAIPEGAETYMVTPGDAGHNWTNSAEYSHLAAMWAGQIVSDAEVTDKDGNPAVTGPVEVPWLQESILISGSQSSSQGYGRGFANYGSLTPDKALFLGGKNITRLGRTGSIFIFTIETVLPNGGWEELRVGSLRFNRKDGNYSTVADNTSYSWPWPSGAPDFPLGVPVDVKFR